MLNWAETANGWVMSISLWETGIKEADCIFLTLLSSLDGSFLILILYSYSLVIINSLWGDIHHSERSRPLTGASLFITGRHLAIVIWEYPGPPRKRRDSWLWLNLHTLSKDAVSALDCAHLCASSLSLLSRFHKPLLGHVLATLVETKEIWLSLVWALRRDHHWGNWDEVVLLNELFWVN